MSSLLQKFWRVLPNGYILLVCYVRIDFPVYFIVSGGEMVSFKKILEPDFADVLDSK